MILIKLIVVILLVLVSAYAEGQTKDELERQRRETRQIIENTTRLLQQTSVDRQSGLERLNIVNRRLQLRHNLLATIEAEIRYLDDSILESENKISKLEKELTEARKSYANLIRVAYRHRFAHQRLMFILSAEDFNQAYRRLRYLQQYGQSRQKQIDNIQSLKEDIFIQIDDLEESRIEQVTLLQQKQRETNVLNKERDQQNSIVDELKHREEQLREELVRQEKIAKALQDAIEELLQEEARIAAEKRIYELTPEETIISNEFRENKGGLPWPTERGVVTGFFGEHPHPVLRGIKIQNNGIDISTVENAEVMVLFDGVVRQVRYVPGSNNVVLVRHGNYLTVYANLSHVYVRAGDQVNRRQLIGRVFTDGDDSENSLLHLEIWEENQKLDPMLWLSRQ